MKSTDFATDCAPACPKCASTIVVYSPKPVGYYIEVEVKCQGCHGMDRFTLGGQSTAGFKAEPTVQKLREAHERICKNRAAFAADVARRTR